ncbi:MAG: hypothetical protein QOI80_3544 [Solirubrobacteraceae bacterium]|jgi:hypothetical protein|nr:hypothetical protein [Solirubrobacteraceae bacterium]
MLVVVGFCAAPAQAADIPVLHPDGTVSQRFDPGVAARGERVPPRPRTTAVAAGRTTLSELRRIYRSGRIDRDEYRGYRDEYQRDRAFARRLSGARQRDMRGVLGTVDRMAARRRLTATRLVPLWLQLRRNREWWSTGPLLANGARVSFDGSELVFQYFPGEGLQIHPLANFGKLNALWSVKTDVDRMEHLMNELLPLAAKRAGGVAWEYYFDFGGGAPPWVSSLAQGAGLQALARSASKAGVADLVFPVLHKALKIFQTGTPSGVRVPAGRGIHYAQYSFAPGLRILNGFLESLVGLFDFAQLANDQTAQRLFDQGNRRAEQEVPTYDTGAWSLYDRGTDQHESDLNYHKLVTEFLESLCDRTGELVYCDALSNFKRYLREVPGVDVLTRRLRAGHTGTLRFRLSKISRLSLQLSRDGKVVYSYGATLGYGTHGVAVRPPRRAAEYEVRIVATDLAGNTGTYTDVVQVVRKRT